MKTLQAYITLCRVQQSPLPKVLYTAVSVTCSQPKILNEKNLTNKQFKSFKLYVVLSVMKPHTVQLHPTQDVNHPLSNVSMLYMLPAY